ncbi:hypothetical protein DK28_0211545 [Peptococcaceae bacterium SCADC1_2_3]|jgi:GNAT superfamily N-acetyltransferase|nr:hypothetical protein DK28_0211545 [Peptococcaceae bacterium SCADC1_2_3]KFI35149.1 hypothetical protein HY00_07030 [Peptococcaceae bacterium SCADC1_2_3]
MIEIKLVNHKERIEELVDLFNIVMRQNQEKISLDFWKWKHLENPLNSSDPKLIVAEDGARIIGARAFMLAEFMLEDNKVKVAQLCDAMVHPDYRRQGIFKKMNDLVISYCTEQGICFFYGFPGTMNPLLRNRVLQKVLPIEYLLRVNNPSTVIAQKLRNPALGNTLGFFYNKLYHRQPKISEKEKQSFTVELFDYFPEALKEIDTLYDINNIELVRSEIYFKWRFDRHPVFKYKYLLARQGEELKGYALISTNQSNNGLITGRIVDYLVKDNDLDCFRILMAQALEELEKSSCDIIFVWEMRNQKFRQELLKRFGFKSSFAFPYQRFMEESYLVARKLNQNLTHKVDIYNPANWNLTMLYPDTT